MKRDDGSFVDFVLCTHKKIFFTAGAKKIVR